jgi:hypothetical protein
MEHTLSSVARYLFINCTSKASDQLIECCEYDLNIEESERVL